LLLRLIVLLFCYCFTATSVFSSNSNIDYYLEHTLFLDISSTEKNIFSVGEQGLILKSEDNGESWSLSKTNTKVLLTSVFFLNENTGWVTGHQGTILKTIDAGKSWQLQHSHSESDPLFDILFINENQGIAIGGYGYSLISNDGGKNWDRINISDDDYHLYAITSSNNDKYYIAGESGTLLVSDNFSIWKKLPINHNGTLFSIQAKNNSITATGIRGSIIHSNDKGNNWRIITTPTTAPLETVHYLKNGQVLAAGRSGALLVGNPEQALSFERILFPVNHSITKIIEISDKQLLISGNFGIRKTPVNIILMSTAND